MIPSYLMKVGGHHLQLLTQLKTQAGLIMAMGQFLYTVTNPDPASGGAETTLRNVSAFVLLNAKYKNGNKTNRSQEQCRITMTLTNKDHRNLLLS